MDDLLSGYYAAIEKTEAQVSELDRIVELFRLRREAERVPYNIKYRVQVFRVRPMAP